MSGIEKIYDCRALANKVKDDAKLQVNHINIWHKSSLSLAVIQVGEIGASSTYVKNKEKACEYVGIRTITHRLAESTTERELVELIEDLNRDPKVTGILVQLPLPGHICEEAVLAAVHFTKDVDCFHPNNVGMLTTGDPIFKPCTAYGIERILDEMGVDPDGKNCVILGRSNIVGKPTAAIMTSKSATVTVCHSRTKDLKAHTLNADILISAIGKPQFITADMVKQGAVVIDVGINRDENGKMCGDALLDIEMLDKVSHITPVPYGVGQMTVAMLMQNVITAFYYQQSLRNYGGMRR